MSIVMWKVLETKVASDEEDVLYRRLEARLERLARESEVPIGAHWESPPKDERATQSDTVLLPPPADSDMVLLAPSVDVGIELVAEEQEPVRATVDEPVVAVEERQAPAAHKSAVLNLQPGPAGPRVARAAAQPRRTTGPAPLRAVAVRPVGASPSAAAARRATVRTTPNS